MTQGLSDLIQQTKNVQAQKFIPAQQAKVQALGGTVKKPGPSILSRVFDVISRPLYGVSEGIARASEHMGPQDPRAGKNAFSDIMQGIAGGLAGKNKTDIGMALERAAEADPGSLTSSAIRGNKYNLKTVAGLVGDIGLDPTTYVGGDIVKAGAEGLAKAAGMTAARAAVTAPEAAADIARATEEARAAKAAELTAKGVDEAKVTKQAGKAANAAGKAVELGHSNPAYEAAYQAAKTNEPGKFVLKFAGKPIAESERVYQAGSKVAQAVGATKTGAALNEAFRTGAKFPEITNRFRRESELAGLAKTNEETRGIANTFKDLTQEEKRQVSHAIEAGPTATAPSSLHGVPGKNVPDLGEFVDKAKQMSADRIEMEKAAGLKFNDLPAGVEPTDQYVPHRYDNPSVKGKFKAVGSDNPGFTMARKFDTLLEAKNAGAQPIEEIDKALALRARAGNSALARKDFVDKVVEAAGAKVDSPAMKALAKEKGYVNISNMSIPGVEKGTWLPEHYAKSLQAMNNMHTDDKAAKQLLSLYDKALGHAKFGMTGLNPGHYVRRTVTGVWQNFLDGVTNPDRYRQAAQLLTHDNPEELAFHVGQDNKIVQTGEDLKRLQRAAGAEPAYFGGEFGPTGVNKFKSKAFQVAEKSDQFTRTAHFIDAFKDEAKNIPSGLDAAAKDKALTEAASRAGERVRHWNGDFGDTTKIEQKFIKRVVPFYTFSRKMIPTQLEALAMRPGKIAMLPKGISAIQRVLKTDEGYNQPTSQVVPSWMKQMASVTLPGEGNFMVPNVPFQQLGQYTEGGTKGVLGNLMSQVTPALRIPSELAMGKDFFTQANIKSTPQYLANQVPLVSQLYNLLHTGQGIAGRNVDVAKLSRYLASSGAYHITPQQQAGELGAQKSQLSKQIQSIRNKYRQKAMGG